jgi:hypothetical protein
MKKKIFILLIILSIISCRKQQNLVKNTSIKSEDTIVFKSVHNKVFQIKDSLFIGEPLIMGENFVYNLENGFKEDSYVGEGYFEDYEKLLKKHNKNFINYKSDEFIRNLVINKNLSLELRRKRFDKKNRTNDIKIILFTKIDNLIKDSIIFYKYDIDEGTALSKGTEDDQRFENISFLDNNLILYHLETYSAQSEGAVGIESWNKYKIDESTGKINLNKKINYNQKLKEQNRLDNNTSVKTLKMLSEDGKKLKKESPKNDYIKINILPYYQTNWKMHCNDANKNFYFSSEGIYFSFPYPKCRFYAKLKNSGKNQYDLFFSDPPIIPIPENLDWKNYSTSKSCGSIIVDNNSEMIFTWLGFYNTKTKKRESLSNPFTDKIEMSPIKLKKCE